METTTACVYGTIFRVGLNKDIRLPLHAFQSDVLIPTFPSRLQPEDKNTDKNSVTVIGVLAASKASACCAT